MSNSISLFAAAEFLEGEIRNASLPDGTRIAVYNINGAYYATADTCTHENASLGDEGMLDGVNIVCGWHFCTFDIASGEALTSPCSEPLQTYPVKVVEGVLHVEY
jgi:p-cumate 2,3-dioxygenase ferredoxin component